MNEDREILAAEYVLGTLHADERTLFVSVLAQDPEAQAAVARWEARFAALNAAVAEVPPPPAVWSRIERQLPPAEPALRLIEGGAGLSNSAVLRRSLARWKAAAVAASLLAAGLAIFVVDRELIRHPGVQPSYVAVVNRGGDQPALIIRVDLAEGAIYVRPLAAEAPSGKSLELWYIGAGKPPKSMGVVGDAAIRMPLPAGLSPEKASFAVTLEPPGGSPTGDPTGPVVYSGQLVRE